MGRARRPIVVKETAQPRWVALCAALSIAASWVAPAWAAEHVVVHEGQSVEAIAAALGDPGLAGAIRALNGLADGAQPAPGTLLQVPALPGAGPEQAAAVLALAGEVTVHQAAGARLVATLGMELPEGSTVCTEAGGFATLRLARSLESLDHDDVTLMPATCLTLLSATARAGWRSTLLAVQQGSVAVRAADTQPGTVTVRTSSGIASGDRGGFRVTVEQDAMRSEALSAPLSVLGAGVERRLAAGQGSRVRTGEAPSEPVDLLVPGVLLAPADGAPLVRPDFAWQPVEHALGYRVELAAAPDFSDILLIEEVDAPAWEPELLFLPFRVPGLWWRVSAFDHIGFLGVPSEPSTLALPGGVGP